MNTPTLENRMLDTLKATQHQLRVPQGQMCYVAEDPDRPGTAWGVRPDLQNDKQETAEQVERWIIAGAVVLYVTWTKALEMLAAWQQPDDSKEAKP